MTQRYEAFKAELLALCEKHGVGLSACPEIGDNDIYVWDAYGDPDPHDAPQVLVDKTQRP